MTGKKVETVSVLWRMARPRHLLLIAFVYLLVATMALAMGATLDALRLLFGLLVFLNLVATTWPDRNADSAAWFSLLAI